MQEIKARDLEYGKSYVVKRKPYINPYLTTGITGGVFQTYFSPSIEVKHKPLSQIDIHKILDKSISYSIWPNIYGTRNQWITKEHFDDTFEIVEEIT